LREIAPVSRSGRTASKGGGGWCGRPACVSARNGLDRVCLRFRYACYVVTGRGTCGIEPVHARDDSAVATKQASAIVVLGNERVSFRVTHLSAVASHLTDVRPVCDFKTVCLATTAFNPAFLAKLEPITEDVTALAWTTRACAGTRRTDVGVAKEETRDRPAPDFDTTRGTVTPAHGPKAFTMDACIGCSGTRVRNETRFWGVARGEKCGSRRRRDCQEAKEGNKRIKKSKRQMPNESLVVS
jgi:hypothetical protein